MNTVSGKVALLVLIIAVLSYVVYNYLSGNSQLDIFIISVVMLCLFLFQVGASLIRDLRKKND